MGALPQHDKPSGLDQIDIHSMLSLLSDYMLLHRTHTKDLEPQE